MVRQEIQLEAVISVVANSDEDSNSPGIMSFDPMAARGNRQDRRGIHKPIIDVHKDKRRVSGNEVASAVVCCAVAPSMKSA
jgi:hypothetical protein